MSDNVLAVGLFWRNDLGCASVVPSEQTSSSYIILDIFSECHMARGAHGWPSLHICRAAGEANIDEVDRAHRGPYHELNISRYSRTRGEYCTYTWKVRNESFLSTTVLCERLKLQCLYSGPLRPNWLDRSFSSCIRQLADSSGGKSEDSWASGPGSSSLCGEVFVTSLFFSFKNWGLRKF